VRPLTATPDLDGWAIVEGLLHDLHALRDRVWLVIDDVHELHSDRALRQLELLVMRAPAELRFVLASRRDPQLGLHRLRLDGELTEIRAADLRFTLEESRALLDAAGVRLSPEALALLYDRTEGWAAGLRLAALSLTGHPDPDLFAAGFSGSERTVAEYLLAEVLGRQPKQVRRLLVRTSMLERVNGELADLLTASPGGPGSTTTPCSPTCSSSSCSIPPRRTSWPACTAWPRRGSANTGSRSRRSATLRRPGTGAWPAGCCPITGSAWPSTERPPPRTTCCAAFPTT
jgi:hypothetical protein